MKGLLIKDFKLLKGQGQFFLMIILITIVMAMAQDPSFIIMYMTFVGASFTLSTISYDEFDNGNAFLFSLPITKRSYIVEKYVFGLMIGSASWLFAVIITAIVSVFHSLYDPFVIQDILMNAFLILPLLMILLAILLPFQFQFGGEKGRIAMIVIIGVTATLMFRIAGLFQIDLFMLVEQLPPINDKRIMIVTMIVAIIILLISIKISVGIMNKKEF